MEPVQNANTTAELLEWHKPEITRLAVSLDTKNQAGSGGDAENYTTRTPA